MAAMAAMAGEVPSEAPGDKSYAAAAKDPPSGGKGGKAGAANGTSKDLANGESQHPNAHSADETHSDPVDGPGDKSFAAAAKEPPPDDANENGSKKKSKKSKKGGKKYTDGEETMTNGHNFDGHLKPPPQSTAPKQQTAMSDSGFHSGGDFDDDDDNTSVYSFYQGHNGIKLTSIRPPDEEEEQSKEAIADQDGKKPREELVSGRHAGAGWERSGIRFAPLNVPLKRRLQTLFVLLHTLSIAGMLTLFFFSCSIPLLWPILLPYLIYVLVSNAHQNGSLSHRSERLRSARFWSLFASYYPARLHRSAELTPTRKYIFGYHPHGIISHGAFAAFATEALGFSQLFPGITNTLLTLESNFRIPFYRDYALRMGLGSVSRSSCTNILTRGGRDGRGMGRGITIVVGGAREALEAHPGHLRLILQARKGFIKLALRTGADLVPVLAFGENDLYEQLDGEAHPHVKRAQLWGKKFMGWTVPLFHARGVFNYDVGMMPYRRPLNVVVGKPILVQKEEVPADDTVDRLHAEYVAELRRLWDEWRDSFVPESQVQMEIVG